jgi:RNA polymerase sigma factor (sigma-70 family)
MDQTHPTDTNPTPLERLEQQERRDRIWPLAASLLSEPQFTALWLYYVEEMGTREVARVLDCSRAMVKTTLFRARAKLRRRLLEMDKHDTRRVKINQTRSPKALRGLAPGVENA